jgi:hypothetical protein
MAKPKTLPHKIQLYLSEEQMTFIKELHADMEVEQKYEVNIGAAIRNCIDFYIGYKSGKIGEEVFGVSVD